MSKHISIMLNEAIQSLNIKENGIYIDATLGRGGHSKKILEKLKTGKLYCFDLDLQAIKESKENLKDYTNVEFIHDNYCNMFKYVDNVDGILMDLGVSSPQFDDQERGFSYRFDSKLDMRMNQNQSLNAFEIVNTYSLEKLKYIFENYGEQPLSYKIASNICKSREEKPIETTFELVEIIKKSLPNKLLLKKGHPAKQVFQALRIETNNELESLKTFLNEFENHLNIDARVAIITFHSLEDKLVKAKFKQLSYIDVNKNVFVLPKDIKTPDYKLYTRKAIVADENEIKLNPRSKSAKLRTIIKEK